MSEEVPIRDLLGINQEDIALLLGISRSQWAMFESGRRNLPASAAHLLAELLNQVQAPQILARRVPEVDQPAKRRAQLERLMQENDYQQLAVERKIQAARKKQESTARLLQLAEYLNCNSKTSNKEACREIAKKASQALDRDYSAELIQLEIKRDTLEIERMYLVSKLRKFSKELENIDEIKD